jgi:hypothetical protein
MHSNLKLTFENLFFLLFAKIGLKVDQKNIYIWYIYIYEYNKSLIEFRITLKLFSCFILKCIVFQWYGFILFIKFKFRALFFIFYVSYFLLFLILSIIECMHKKGFKSIHSFVWNESTFMSCNSYKIKKILV